MSYVCFYFFFFKQKTAYEMRISDWSSDVCSSDLDELSYDKYNEKADRIFRVVQHGTWSGGEFNLAVTSAPYASALKSDYPEVEDARSEERRVGKECVSTCRSRWSPYH